MDGFGAAKDPGQRVIVLRGHGVKLVIVAAGATERKSQEGLADSIDLLIDGVHATLFLVRASNDFGADHQEAGRGNLFVPLFLAGAGKKVARDLLTHELVERFVFVKRIDDVVPKAPCVVVGKVLVQPVGIGVAGTIQPVAAPALAELLGAQQPIHHPLDRLRRVVVLKSFHLFWRGRQADEVERQAAQQDQFAGIAGWKQVLLFQFGEDETVDRAARPALVFHGGEMNLADRLIRPEIPVFLLDRTGDGKPAKTKEMAKHHRAAEGHRG